MAADHQTMPQPQFRDRSVGLIVFGLFQIMLACGCAMMIFVMLMATRMNPQGDMRMMIPAVGIYGMMAALFFWLGVGSIMARRWARALTLTIAWIWLVFGGMASIVMFFVMPFVFDGLPADQKMPPEGVFFFQSIMVATMSCVYVLLPAILILFYRSADVRATCELRDPGASWTDNCPLPVLALSVLMASAAVSMPLSVAYNRVLPFFGTLLTGAPAVAVMLTASVLFAYLAWAIYKLKPSAWWLALILYVAFFASSIVTFSRIELMDYYRAMDMPQEQLDAVQKITIFNSFNMNVYMTVIMLATVGYLLWIRRYFVAKPLSEAGPSAS